LNELLDNPNTFAREREALSRLYVVLNEACLKCSNWTVAAADLGVGQHHHRVTIALDGCDSLTDRLNDKVLRDGMPELGDRRRLQLATEILLFNYSDGQKRSRTKPHRNPQAKQC